MTLLDKLKIHRANRALAQILKRHPTWCLITLSFLLIIYALIIFGLYALKNPPATEINAGLKIDSETYQSIIAKLKARDTNIQQGIGQNYPDIFK